MFSDTKERQNMSEYGMCFAPCEKPMGASGRYEKVLEAFWAGDDECIGCEFDDLKKAKTAQSYEGSVIVELTLPEDSDGNRELMVEVQVNSNTASRGKSLFYGALDEFCQKLGGKTLSEIA